ALTRLLKDVDLQDKSLEPFATTLIHWDGFLTVDAKAGPLFAIWLRTLQDEFYSGHVPLTLPSPPLGGGEGRVSGELNASLAALSGLPVMLDALRKAD